MSVTNKHPLVSIVIPVYNGSNYLSDAIDSAINQTYGNIEVLVINDGSTDNGATAKIAKSYGKKIRYFEKPNGGVASALNYGIKKMKGEWFSWLSHDDYISPNRISSDIALVNDKYYACFSDIKFIDKNGNLIGKKQYHRKAVSSPKECWEEGGLHMCSLTINSICLKELHGFNEQNELTQDIEFTLRLSSKCSIVHNATLSTSVRIHSDSDTNRKKSQRRCNHELLANIIEHKLGINSFFPKIELSTNYQKSNAWGWMGELYRVLDSYERAQACYLKSFQYEKNTRTFIKIILGPRIISVMSKIVSLIDKNYKKSRDILKYSNE